MKKILSGLADRLKKAALFVKEHLIKIMTFLKNLKRKYIIIGIVGLVILAGGVYAAISLLQIANLERILLDQDDFSSGVEYSVDEEFPENIVNIAILGFDRNAEREEYSFLFLPDFLAVITINFETDEVAFVRVLRDSYVPISVTGVKDKINHSYYHGYMHGSGPDRDANGLKCTLDTLSTVLGGIPIQYYVSVDMDGLAYMVDALGGVEHRVKENLYDKYGNRILKKGVHHFSGEEFVLYVRHRDDNTGQDVGRAYRQFDILEDLFESVRDKGMLKNIPTFFKVYRDYINTNLTLKQVAALAYYARNIDPTDDMFYCLDGTSQTKDGIWYWVLDQAQRVRLIREVFGITVAAWPQEVLTDTPPPPLKFFEYKIRFDKNGNPSVELTWEPGDGKKVVYELYRDGELLEELEGVTYYTDKDVELGDTYNYTLVVRHYRAKGDPHGLTVYVAPPQVEVPDVVGMTEKEAQKLIENAGLDFVHAEEFSDKVPKGIVIKTVPVAGTEVEPGSAVTVVVSLGPVPEKQIPDADRIIGKTEDQVRRILEELNLNLRIETIKKEYKEGFEDGQVYKIVPAPGQTVRYGDTVTIYVSKGPEEPVDPGE